MKLLYVSPQAAVRTNGTNSENFRLYRSTRQGCPLSPLLFAIVMEPLSIALRSHPDICGITRNGVELKVALYVDDLLLLLSDLSCSMPAALFSPRRIKISGYELNLNKSELFAVNRVAKEYSFKDLSFKISNSGFVYLEMHVGDTLVNLYQKNFLSLLTQT